MAGLVQRTEELLGELLPDVKLSPRADGRCWSVDLPPTDGADYRFALYVYDDEELQVTASRLAGQPDEYFWYHPFEAPDYDSPAQREGAFLAAVKALLTQRSRIRYRRGLLSASFKCEVTDGEAWQQVGPAMSCLRWAFQVPRDIGRSACFKANPLAKRGSEAGRLTSY
jgi:hypothetical protein